MTSALGMINFGLTRAFDLFLAPFLTFEPVWAMIFVSLIAGLFMLWVFAKISDQDEIKRVKNLIRGNLLGVRLFQHDLGVVMRLQGRILRHTLTYMKYSVFPMLVMIVPVCFIVIQLNLHFSVSPLGVGEKTLVKVKMRDAESLGKQIVLETPEGVQLETPAVRIDSEREIVWRIRGDKEGRYALRVKIGTDSLVKELIVGERWSSVSAIKTGKSFWNVLLWPGEAPIAKSHVVESVEINYPTLSMALFGWDFHWLVWFFVLSVAFGFAFKGVFGVEV